MSASNAFETDLLEFIFHKTPIPGLEAADPEVFIALHTADPGEDGTQGTSEATYTGYLRQAIARIAGNLQVLGSDVANVNEIAFPEATGGNDDLTHFSIGRAGGGIIKSGSLGGIIPIATGEAPKFEAGSLIARSTTGSSAFEADLSAHLYNAVAIPNLGPGDSDVFIALHTADPGSGGTQATNEAAYTGYVRQSVARLPANWQVLGAEASNLGVILFPTATGGPETITHASVGRAGGDIIRVQALDTPLAIVANKTPKFVAGNLKWNAN